MFNYIKGQLAYKISGGIVIENNGIGYEISIPDNSNMYKLNEGEKIEAFTTMIVREDDISLYGFDDKNCLYMFKKLMTVTGVGAKAALSILSSMPLDMLSQAIVFEDPIALTKANGIGKKTAQRIVLELKDKVEVTAYKENPPSIINTSEEIDERSEAVNGLMALGYSKAEALGAISKIQGDNLSTEDYIKQSLKKLF